MSQIFLKREVQTPVTFKENLILQLNFYITADKILFRISNPIILDCKYIIILFKYIAFSLANIMRLRGKKRENQGKPWNTN